jgi:8-oxo-dGTP pyrophosphatase MutT (NUDIX family)
VKAAGILFLTKKGSALFLRRAPISPDFGGYWDFPGGGALDNESAEDCAVREAIEEVGEIPGGVRLLHTRSKSGSASQGAAGTGAPTAALPGPEGAPAVPPQPDLAVVELSPLPDVDFSTFLQRVNYEFTPELNNEHDGWAWAPVASPPEPLHPGCRIALERLAMDEVGVARAIAEGRLTSPQRYENVTLWAMRITGTGVSYRPKHDEFVLRKPEVHLTPEALARLNGLPVIFKHPAKAILNSEEFAARIVGTIFLPYVAGDEAWGIAKVFDDETNQALSDGEYSTSPGVNFRDFSVNARLTLEDGSKVLVEGKPSLFDHIAICELGVWDKDGEPAGIRSEAREDSAMTEDEKTKAEADKAKADAARKDAEEKEEKAEADAKKKRDDAARKDADAGTSLDKTLSGIADSVKGIADNVASLSKRMDDMEASEKDRRDHWRDDGKKRDDGKRDDGKRDDEDMEEAEELAAKDKAKKDSKKRDDEPAENQEMAERIKAEKEKKDDSAKADARADDIRDRLADMEKRITASDAKITPLSDDDHAMLADAWSRCDSLFLALGKQTPRAMPGETSMRFRRRTTKMLKEFSPTWKSVDLSSAAFADDAAFAIIEGQIHSEAAKTARDPVTVSSGELRMIETRIDGHTVREFVGQPRTWMNPLAGDVQLRAEGSFKVPGHNRSN